jgi:RNA-binding protein YlmH
MGLGIKRETLGDIVINENKGYLICLESISKYITDNLIKVKNTSVRCDLCDKIPSEDLPKPTEKTVIVSSLRLDVLISGVYDISRSKSAALIEGEKVFINGKLAVSNSINIENNTLISVRGYGRFRYTRILGTTRKDRIRILCEVY